MSIKILVLILVQKELMEYAYISRGYFAIGGELLVIPLVYVLFLLYEYKKEENENNERV